MIDLCRYFEKDFASLDVIGTTSFGAIPKAIWRYTWGKQFRFPWIKSYMFRANQSTHTAITCVGRNGKKWIVEMDNTSPQNRYVSIELGQILLPEEYDQVKHSLSDKFQEVRIFSGVKLTNPEKYFSKNIRNPHACWIGRYPFFDEEQKICGNEWLFEKVRSGVKYDYMDIPGLMAMAKNKKGVIGSTDVYVCSELVQKCYEHIGILRKTPIPMTPQDWQCFNIMRKVV